MRSHIEQQKVALLRAQQPFVDEAFGGAFADLGECQRAQNGGGVSDSEGEDGAAVESEENMRRRTGDGHRHLGLWVHPPAMMAGQSRRRH
jgi:hypothetical protein